MDNNKYVRWNNYRKVEKAVDKQGKVYYYMHMERVPHIRSAQRIKWNADLQLEEVKEIETMNVAQYTMLEAFVKSEKHENGKLVITDSRGNSQEFPAESGYYKWMKIPLTKNEAYEIKALHADVSTAYLSGSENIMQDGICYLEIDSGGARKIEGRMFKEYYDTSYREQYHFVPFKNWINDPNGLCWYKGYYHLYFQANPHGQEWNNMYWGHAASKDLVHWVHLPYVLEPQQELYKNPEQVGGAFSGSAVALEDETVFYLTRHEAVREDEESVREWQVMTRSRDMIHFEQESVIIEEKPAGAGNDFRDPKVMKINGKWYMVLASNLNGESAILLYSSEDMKNWTYENPLVTEPDKRSTTFECPDFFELDGKHVAVAALMKHIDECGRYQMTRYYIGDFINQKLEVEKTGWFDFGSNYYAVQSFEHEGRRIAIGWISDFYNEHVTVENGAYGSFALPRQLSIRENRLNMEPVPEVYTLKDKELYRGAGENVSLDYIPGNSYYAKIGIAGETEFSITLSRDNEAEIVFMKKDGITKIKTAGVKSGHADFVADVDNLSEIEIFVDRKLVEIFINKGQAAGAKLFYNSNRDGIFEARFEKPGCVKNMELYTMKSIW